jgi:hypothetical protein
MSCFIVVPRPVWVPGRVGIPARHFEGTVCYSTVLVTPAAALAHGKLPDKEFLPTPLSLAEAKR